MSAAKRLLLPEGLARETARLLDSFAETGPAEGVVYWFGIETSTEAVVTTLVVPDADTSDGSVSTSEEANAEVLTSLGNAPLILLGQAHSHPGWNVSHSPTDDKESFAVFDGYLSIVVPWFGRYGLEPANCGVYRFQQTRFGQVPRAELSSHILVVPSLLDLRRSP